ncbi:hypothetical protein PtA15_4A301 [Puccinia triticina]|uniref:Uncharacterized protein n=1 Tax=Puccinia triticina TaxID=208348 RepID=A0ABY7CIS3_9BASI|nr:uncharacterized protein PtA15_4A301 [Puccinia triticina]WAQ83852.1 hypothetical protein PtA15_4A301 [Puccinia triticina]
MKRHQLYFLVGILDLCLAAASVCSSPPKIYPRALPHEIVEGANPLRTEANVPISPGAQNNPRPGKQLNVLNALQEKSPGEDGTKFQSLPNFNFLRVKKRPENLALPHENIGPHAVTTARVKEEPNERNDEVALDYRLAFYPSTLRPQLEDNIPDVHGGKRKDYQAGKATHNSALSKKKKKEMMNDKGKKPLLDEPTTPPQSSRKPLQLAKGTNFKPSPRLGHYRTRTQPGKYLGYEKPEEVFVKLMAAAVPQPYLWNTETRLLMISLMNKIFEDTSTLKKLDETRGALLAAIENSPLARRWMRVLEHLKLEISPFVNSLGKDKLKELQAILSKKEAAKKAYKPAYCKPDMSTEIHDLEPLFKSVAGHLQIDPQEYIPWKEAQSENAIWTSHPDGSSAEMTNQELAKNDGDRVKPTRRRRKSANRDIGILANSIIVDGEVSAMLKWEFGKVDHPERPSAFRYDGVGNGIMEIYKDSLELKELKYLPESLSAKEDAFRRVLVIFTYFLKPMFLANGSAFFNLCEEATHNFESVATNAVEMLQVFKAGNHAVMAQVENIRKGSPQGMKNLDQITIEEVGDNMGENQAPRSQNQALKLSWVEKNGWWQLTHSSIDKC